MSPVRICLLSPLGLQVGSGSTGQDAVQRIESRHGSTTKPAFAHSERAVLLDMLIVIPTEGRRNCSSALVPQETRGHIAIL